MKFKLDKRNRIVLKRLWKYLYHFKWRLLLAAVIAISSNLLALVGPLLSGKAIDAIVLGKSAVNFDDVFLFSGLMIIFYTTSAVLNYILSILMINITQKVIVSIRRDVFNKLSELPVSYFDNIQTGDIISRISYDIDTMAASLSNDVIQICTSIITVIGSFVLMIVISPLLILIFVITIPVSIITTRSIAKRVRPLYSQRSQRLGKLNAYAEEIITGHKTIKAYNAEEKIIEKFDRKNQKAVDAYYTADYYGTVSGPTMNLINNVSISLVSMFGVFMFMANLITLGNVSSFTLYSRKFSGPINEFANILTDIQSAFAASERVFAIIDEQPEKADSENAIELVDTQGNVKAQCVKFGYVEDKLVLKGINFDAYKGKMVAIVGPTGCGKSTIINLLMRFYDAESGDIFVDDNEIKDITRNSLRLSYSMVLQDTWLFKGTIFENLAYTKSNATLDEVKMVARAAKIDGFINSLPDGYDTVIDEEGMNISKGQKQLLTIARAMLSDAKMLILDEATSNVDTRTELKIQQAMMELMKGRTCFVIAHRLSTIINADEILVMKDGEIIERGTHNQLLNDDTFYREMYHSQYE